MAAAVGTHEQGGALSRKPGWQAKSCGPANSGLAGFLWVNINYPFQAARPFCLIKGLADPGEYGIQVFAVVTQNHQLRPVAVSAAGDHCRQWSPDLQPVASGERLDPVENLQALFHAVGFGTEYGHGAKRWKGTGLPLFKELVGNRQIVAPGQRLQ